MLELRPYRFFNLDVFEYVRGWENLEIFSDYDVALRVLWILDHDGSWDSLVRQTKNWTDIAPSRRQARRTTGSWRIRKKLYRLLHMSGLDHGQCQTPAEALDVPMALYGAAGASAEERSRKTMRNCPVSWMCWIVFANLLCIDIGFLRFPWWLRSIIPRKSQTLSQWGRSFCQKPEDALFISIFSLFSSTLQWTRFSQARWNLCFWLLLSKPVRTLVQDVEWRTLLTTSKLWISGRKDLSMWKLKARFDDGKTVEWFSNGKTGKPVTAVTWWFCQGSETRSWWLFESGIMDMLEPWLFMHWKVIHS